MPPPATIASMKEARGRLRLLDPDLFNGLLDLGRTVGLQVEDGRLRRGGSVRHPDLLASTPAIRRRALPIARSPTICAAITFTMVIDGKIMA